jgi:imidazolonepropionase-like amidohydrolase
MKKILFSVLLPLGLLVGAASAQELPFETEAHRKPAIDTGGNVLIQGARILTVTHGTIPQGDVLVRGGKIVAIGRSLQAPAGVTVIDARGKVLMPGIVDAHIHRGSDATNEGSDSITAEVRIQDVLNPNAKNVWQALASGQTSGLILHGSANIVGGQSAVVKLKYNRRPDEMLIADAPRMIKFALGENVTRSGSTTSTRFPRTRMGVQAAYRRAFTEAQQYMAEWARYEQQAAQANGNAAAVVPPRKDLRLETLADILKGDVWVHCHSYRADEMLMMVRLSQEFGFKIGAMQHALEAYKIAPELAQAGVGVSIFVDNWSFKVEGYDAIPWNAAICTAAGVNVSINTDGTSGTTAINIDAAKTMRFGGLTEDQALATITINPAKQLGIDHRTGSIEVGKDADFAIWDGHPLSVYSKPWMTLIEGEVFFQRRDAHEVDADSFTKHELSPQSLREEPAPLPLATTYAIVGGTVMPVSGPPMPNATVIIQNGRITAVGERIAIPRDAVRVDARGMFVLPGFIDAGTSLGLAEISPIRQTVDNAELGEYQPDLHALTAFFIETAHLGPARYNGVTNALTRPTGGVISGQAAFIQTEGWTYEQLGIRSPAALAINFPGVTNFPVVDPANCCELHEHHVTGGHDHDLDEEELMGGGQRPGGQGGQGGGQATSGQLRALNEYFDSVAEYRKQRAENPDHPVNLQLEAMIPYVDGQAPIIFRVRNAASIRAAVQFIQDRKLRGVLSGAADAWREAPLLAATKIPVIVSLAGRSTLGANTTVSDHDPYDTPYALPALLARAGVPFCFQTEDNAGVMNFPFRVGQHVPYGLTQDQALRAATLSAAEIFGVADQVGSIEPGKLGNIIVVDGDPFELTSRMQYVFIAGRPVPLVSKHTQLRDKYMQRLQR